MSAQNALTSVLVDSIADMLVACKTGTVFTSPQIRDRIKHHVDDAFKSHLEPLKGEMPNVRQALYAVAVEVLADNPKHQIHPLHREGLEEKILRVQRRLIIGQRLEDAVAYAERFPGG